jgi:single-stranded-DNA-specific exonuclease
LDKYAAFKDSVRRAADAFHAIKHETVRVISHLDSDGICAASILIHALTNENIKYSLSIVQQVNEKLLSTLKEESDSCIFFTDLGSGQFEKIATILAGKRIFILDHHELDTKHSSEGFTHVNPHLFGINGSKEISGAGVVYLFCSYLNEKNKEMVHIAIVGAIGDVQENQGFLQLNNEFLEEAKRKGKIKVKRGLRFFGMQTRPLHKILEYSTDPYIPDVSGNEYGAIKFLEQIGINPKEKKKWKRMNDLTEDEMKHLVTHIILQRLNESKPDDVLGNIYLLPDEKDGSPFKDAKEFSTLLNACGRLSKPSLGIGVCLGDKQLKKKAIGHMSKYKREIIKAMKWYHSQKNSPTIIEEDGYVILNAKNNVLSTMIGTMASLLAKSNEFKAGTYILSLAHDDHESIKVSLRISGRKPETNLKEVMHEITSKIPGAEAGGHQDAAGAIIPLKEEENFIEMAKKVLRNLK